MNYWKTTKLTVWGMLLLIFLTCAFTFQAGPGDESKYEEYPVEPFGFWWKLEWRQASPEALREAQGLLFTEAAARGLVDRLIYKSSTGQRVIVTRTAAPRQGLLYEHIRDDETGWWIELKLDFDHQWNGWRHFAFTLDEVFDRSSDRIIEGHLTTSDGLKLSLKLPPVQGGLPDAEAFSQALKDLSAVSRLAESVPAPIIPALYELTVIFTEPLSMGASSKWFAELLREVLPSPENWKADRETGWVQSTSKIHLGLGLTEPEMLEFTSRFQSISNADPLGDHRLAKAVPADGGP